MEEVDSTHVGVISWNEPLQNGRDQNSFKQASGRGLWTQTKASALDHVEVFCVLIAMAKDDARSYIRREKRNTRSIADQVEIAHAMWDEDIGHDHDGLKASEIEDELGLNLEFTVKTSLKHLGDIGVLEEFKPAGPDTFAIATWKDGGEGEIVNGEVGEAAREALTALADEVEEHNAGTGQATAADGGQPIIRSVLADEFDLVADRVPEFLRTTDREVDVLNDAVDAIEANDDVEVSEDYGKIAFINMPHRFRLTEWAEEVYAK